MKKALILAGAMLLADSLPASAQIIIQPAIVAPPAPVVAVAPGYYPGYYYPGYAAPYPVYIEPHRRYNWRYWHERREHERYYR